MRIIDALLWVTAGNETTIGGIEHGRIGACSNLVKKTSSHRAPLTIVHQKLQF